MPDLSTIVGLAIAGVVGLAYLLAHIRHRRSPDLTAFRTVALASVALVSGVDFGVNAATADLSCLPAFNANRLVMVLGAVAVVWLGARELWRSFTTVLVSRPHVVQRHFPAESG